MYSRDRVLEIENKWVDTLVHGLGRSDLNDSFSICIALLLGIALTKASERLKTVCEEKIIAILS